MTDTADTPAAAPDTAPPHADSARAAGATARPAVWADADPLSESLARAFHDDPVMMFFFRDASRRQAKLPKLFRLIFKLGLPHGGSFVTSGYEATALWRPPGKWEIPWWQYITNAAGFIDVLGADFPHALGGMAVIEKNHPHDRPHWYLQVLGTDTAKQGKGYASLVMRRQLADIDAAHLPAYLESSKETNIPVYASYGFEVTGALTLPGGPTLYPMWRDAR
jgi:ribosomal protein S18 acetylase RimI-like enzyme